MPRFRRIAKGVYVAAAAAESHRIGVRGVMLTLPPGTIATGVTGLQLLGVDAGAQLPMISRASILGRCGAVT